jgi:amino acid adenylation domain-containing protein
VTVRQLVEDQARRAPDAVAVVSASTQLTYGELNSRANRLAHHLRGLGVLTESKVGLFLGREEGLIEAMLAVHKAGGAYVPLDPDHSAERLDLLLRDVDAKVVVTTGELATQLPEGPWTPVCVNAVDLADHPVTDPEPRCEPHNLAYVLFTSGSTGTPKGVAVEHGALHDRTIQIMDRYELTQADVCLQSLSAGFDASAGEIFPTLAAGARLVLGDHDWMPERILEEFRRHDVTVSQLPMSVWQRLTALVAESGGLADSLRLLLLGGEPLMPSAVADWFRVASVPLMNLYGPTEATITTSAALITRPSAVIPIGTPLGDTGMHVTDEQGRSVPMGVPGELWISGGLARGYLNQPQLTAERFVRREFDGEVRAVYRTGDVVRQLPDGQFEFRGRTDDQVKVNGFRVEPGEVTAQLLAHPDVVSCFVTVRPTEAGSPQLVAYCQLKSADVLSASAARQWCARLLPAYMIPGAFVFVEALPLNENGKVDRDTLPSPQPSGAQQSTADGRSAGHVEPRNDTERLIAAAFADVLGLEQVGAEDDFFELGGDSFRSIQFISLVRDAGLRISPRTIFAHPTVAGMAQHVKPAPANGKAPSATTVVSPARGRQALRFEVVGSLETTELGTQDTRVSVVHFNEGPAERILFCLHEVSGSVNHYTDLAAELAPVARVIGIEASTVAFETTPVNDVTAMARSYFDAIRALQPRGPYFLAGYSFGGILGLEIAKLIDSAGDRVELLVAIDSTLPVLGSVGMIERDVEAGAALVVALTDDRTVDNLRSDPEFVQLMLRLNLPDALLDLPKSQLRQQIEVLNAHFAAGLRFRPPTVPCNVLLFQAEITPWVTPLAEIWAPYVADVDDRFAPGGHIGVMRPPGVLEIATEVSKRLAVDIEETADAR